MPHISCLSSTLRLSCSLPGSASRHTHSQDDTGQKQQHGFTNERFHVRGTFPAFSGLERFRLSQLKCTYDIN
ncbi:hypothetical protein J4Q44_G00333530, partial [Coregonus suidteri]